MIERFSQNTLAIIAAIFVLAGPVVSQVQDNALRTELLAMSERDQQARKDCPTGNADEHIKCLARVSDSVDKPNTQRLEEIVKKVGVPDAKMVGADGVQAFFLILQHSPSLELKKRSQKGMKKAYVGKIISAHDYANFTDRLLVTLGKPQIYGAHFDFKDGKLVMAMVKDRKNLDARRKKLGLPPIAEYARELGELFKMETVVPK